MIQPTQGGAAVYAVTPAGGPQTMPTSDSAFAQRIMNAQELQNAQSAITGVPSRQNATAGANQTVTPNATNFAALQTPAATTNIAQTANVPTTGYATQTPRATSNVGASFAETPTQTANQIPAQTVPAVSPPVQGGFDDYAPASAPNAVQRQPVAVQSPNVAPFPAELGAAPTAPGTTVEDDFPELLPF